MHGVGIPSYSVLGWQRPCYLMADGYAVSYKELIETTDWDAYGRGKDARCANCMAHCGYEPSAVIATMGSLRQSLRALVATRYRRPFPPAGVPQRQCGGRSRMSSGPPDVIRPDGTRTSLWPLAG